MKFSDKVKVIQEIMVTDRLDRVFRKENVRRLKGETGVTSRQSQAANALEELESFTRVRLGRIRDESKSLKQARKHIKKFGEDILKFRERLSQIPTIPEDDDVKGKRRSNRPDRQRHRSQKIK